MACPYFQPTEPVSEPSAVGGRLPLIDEHEGTCLASSPVPVSTDVRRECCNQGYTQGRCARFPQEESPAALRYSVVRQTPEALEILCIAEKEYAPLWFRQVSYSIAVDSVVTEDLDPPIAAQAAAFCRSYLRLWHATQH